MPAYPNTYILHMKASITVLLAYDIVVEPKKMFFAKILPKQLKHECSCTPRKPLSRFRGAYTLDLFWCSDPVMWGLGKGGDRKSWSTIKKQTIALKIQSFILALFWRFWPESTSKSAFTWSLYLGWTWRYRFLSQHGPVWKHCPLFVKISRFSNSYHPFAATSPSSVCERNLSASHQVDEKRVASSDNPKLVWGGSVSMHIQNIKSEKQGCTCRKRCRVVFNRGWKTVLWV